MDNVILDAFFEIFEWPAMLSLFLRELIIEKLLWGSVIVHLDDNVPSI